MPIDLHDGVEITRINGPDNFIVNPNLAVGSQRPTSANDDLTNNVNSEFNGKYLFLCFVFFFLKKFQNFHFGNIFRQRFQTECCYESQ